VLAAVLAVAAVVAAAVVAAAAVLQDALRAPRFSAELECLPGLFQNRF